MIRISIIQEFRFQQRFSKLFIELGVFGSCLPFTAGILHASDAKIPYFGTSSALQQTPCSYMQDSLGVQETDYLKQPERRPEQAESSQCYLFHTFALSYVCACSSCISSIMSDSSRLRMPPYAPSSSQVPSPQPRVIRRHRRIMACTMCRGRKVDTLDKVYYTLLTDVGTMRP